MLNALYQLTEKITRLSALMGGMLILFSAFLITIDIILRKVFTISIGGADELSSYALAIGSSWALGYALFCRANIRVDVICYMLPLKLRVVVDLLALIALGVVVAVCSIYVFYTLADSWQFDSHANTPLQTPLVIPQLLWFIGFVVCVWTFILLFIKSSVAIFQGKFNEVNGVIGTRSIKEEINDETHLVKVEQQANGG
ncbi:TRAP transporter small permease subunit [Spartinivicinus ruber]|uniref:TRAP transporter small permease subunit n=1 Tax=Spartinivicinus ruber TaxID=2683272 RepID=UPI0013D0CB39|nr:TRAP transporter small permease [Spartinivicinus ruber]